jgi:hypothetical protein
MADGRITTKMVSPDAYAAGRDLRRRAESGGPSPTRAPELRDVARVRAPSSERPTPAGVNQWACGVRSLRACELPE